VFESFHNIANPSSWWFLKLIKYLCRCFNFICASLQFQIMLPLPQKKIQTVNFMKFYIWREIHRERCFLHFFFWPYSLSNLLIFLSAKLRVFLNFHFGEKNRQNPDFSRNFSSLNHFPLNKLGPWCIERMCVSVRPLDWRITWVGGVCKDKPGQIYLSTNCGL